MLPKWKATLESQFGHLAKAIYRRPIVTIFVVIGLVAVTSSQLRHLYLDTSTEGFLSPSHPAIQTYNQFRDTFGKDELIIVGAKTDYVLDPAFLAQFKQLFRQIETTLPHTESVDSMLNARFVYGKDDELVVEDLFQHWPQKQADFTEILKRMEENELYKGLFLGRDYGLATITIRLPYLSHGDHSSPSQQQIAHDAQSDAVLSALDQLLEPFRQQGMELYVAGSPVVSSLLRTAMVSDMQTFTLWVILAITSLLALLFKRVSGVLFPLISVAISIVFTVSLMGLFRQPLQLPTAILPSFLLVVGIGDSIHFLSFFYREFNSTGNKQAALVGAMEHTGLAMLLTSLTTAAGMASFSNANLLPVANLGIFTAIGVMVAFTITILVVPALLCITPIRQKQISTGSGPVKKPFLDQLINGAAHVSFHYPKRVVTACVLLLIMSAVLSSQMQFSHNPLKWFPDEYPEKQSITAIDNELGGSISLEIMIDTGQENGVYDPTFLRNLDQLSQQLKQFKTEQFAVNKVLSVTDLLKESNRALHNNDQSFYQIPQQRALVAQELFLLELSGADDLFRMVDREYSIARISLTLPWIDTLLYAPLMENLEQEFQDQLGNQYHIAITGLIPLLGSTLHSVIHSAAQAYAIALVVISLIMMLLLGSFKLGAISMFPNLLPIIMVIGLMQLNGVPFDMFTILIGSIAIGLCVDDTVHFMHHFSRYRAQGCGVKQAIENTLHTAGRAMLVTSIVLCSGFMVLTLSQLNNFTHFGLYTSLCIMLALLADFLLAPALMTLISRGSPE